MLARMCGDDDWVTRDAAERTLVKLAGYSKPV